MISAESTNHPAPRMELSENVARHVKMSSREIAELVGKRHDNVKRTIETLTESGVIVRPQIEDEPGVDSLGRPRATQVYLFSGEKGKRDSIVVVAQLSPEFTAALVDRWQELEAERQAPCVPRNLPEALRLAADLAERNSHLQLVVEEQAPKVRALAVLTETDGAVCITDAAKEISLQPKALFRWMEANRWIYRRVGSSRWIAYQPRLQQGVLVHKLKVLGLDDQTGQQKVAEQVLVTRKGLAVLCEKLAGRIA